MSQQKRGSTSSSGGGGASASLPKRNAQSDMDPHEPERLKAISRLWIHPSWDKVLFSKGQVWVGVRMEGSTILGDCFDCRLVPPPAPDAPGYASPLHTTLNGAAAAFACRPGFQVLAVTPSSLEMAFDQIPGCQSRATFVAPARVYERVFTKSISCVDVHWDLQMGAAASVDKSVRVWSLGNEEIKCDLQDQGETNVVKWLPNAAQAVIAYSADSNAIKLYNVRTMRSVRSLRAHTGKVSDLLFAEGGRHLFSAGQDGQIRLWDVTRSEPLESVAVNLGFTINCLDVQSADPSLKAAFGDTPSPADPKDGRVLMYGGDDGFLRMVCLRSSHKALMKRFLDDRVQCCRFLQHPYLACGTESGQMYYLDWRRPDTPVCHWREIRGCILCITSSPQSNGVICGTADGSCFYRNPLLHPQNEYSMEFCGAEYEPVFRVCRVSDQLFSCCRDGKIRRYTLTA